MLYTARLAILQTECAYMRTDAKDPDGQPEAPHLSSALCVHLCQSSPGNEL